MSTNFEKIFTDTTGLKAYTLYLNDRELLVEDVISLELSFDIDTPAVGGKLVLKDSLGIADLDLWDGKTTLKIYANDIHEEKFSRIFRVTNVANDTYNERFKRYTLTLIDEPYYRLVNTYLSKGFTSDPISAFQKYSTHLELDTYFQDNQLTANYDTFDGEDYSFVVPQDRSALEFFKFELRKYGYRFWQGRKSMNIKKLNFSELESLQLKNPDSNALEDVRYTNDTNNNTYAFKIHDFTMNYNNILNSNIENPIKVHYAYDPLNKKMDTTTTNLQDMYESIKLNTKDMSDLQHTTGQRYDVDAEVFLGDQKIGIENAYFRNNSVEIVVPGNFKYNDVGVLADVRFAGNPIMQVSTLEGDIFHSGKYFISKVTDRYIGNKLIQKLTLHRADFQKPRKQK